MTEKEKTEKEKAILIRGVLNSELPEVQSFINLLADYADEWRKHPPTKPFFTFREIGLPARLWIGNPKTLEATILFEVDQYAQIFEGADLRRLKRCPICQKIFWAFPEHKTGCNKAHSNLVAKRKERGQPIKRLEGRKK